MPGSHGTNNTQYTTHAYLPGGVGFDINCGVRLIRTNLTEKDVAPVKEQLTQSLFDHIPVGGSCWEKPMCRRVLID